MPERIEEMKKRILSILLLTALLLSSCASTPDTQENDPPETSSASEETVIETEPETAPDTKDYVPEMSFDKDMNLLLPDMSWITKNIISEEMNGERLNDAQ